MYVLFYKPITVAAQSKATHPNSAIVDSKPILDTNNCVRLFCMCFLVCK
jgi:hypothetical protein